MIVLFAAVIVVAQVEGRRAAERAPAPVRAFIRRRAGCDHWGGEEPYDEARRREIERVVRNLRCDTLDGDERALKRRFARDRAALRLLDQTGDADGDV